MTTIDHTKSSKAVDFILVLDFDLSLNTGYSINERESSVALLDHLSDRMRVVCPRPAFPEVFCDARIDYIRNHNRRHPLLYPLFAFALHRKLRQLLHENPSASVIFRLAPLPIVEALMVRTGASVILKKLSGYAAFQSKGRSLLRRTISKVAEPLYRYIAVGCVGADTESYAYASWLPSKFRIEPSKLKVIPNGANTEMFAPQGRLACRRQYDLDQWRNIVGYVGGLDDLRGLDEVLQVAHRLRDKPGLLFVLVGEGPRAESLRDAIDSGGLEDRVLLLGSFPYQAMPSVINGFDVAFDLTCVPFEIGSETFHGSYSQKIAQYLACGVPVIAWETRDTAFLDEERIGRTVPVGDVDTLASGILELLERSERGENIAERASAYARDVLSARAIAQSRVKFWEGLRAPSGAV